MKVEALTRTTSLGPSTRYRIEQYRPALLGMGIEIRTRPLFGPAWFAIRALRPAPLRWAAKAVYSTARLAARLGQRLAVALGDADLVLVEQQLFPYLPAWIERALWPRGPSILEFDDAIFLTPLHLRKLERLCAAASVVIVGNRFLADFAAPHARRVAVIPTTVDVARYAPAAPRAEDGVLDVVWIGLPYNLPSLAMVAEPLAALAGAGLRCRLTVVSSEGPADPTVFGGCEVVVVPWSERTETEVLARADVGIMPLPDTAWSRGKCGLKLLQCMAAGLAVVASPVGVNTEIVRDGRNGLLADGPLAWRAALARLAADPALRARLGAAGRRTVEQHYSLERGAPLLAETYLQAVRAPRA